MVEGWGLMLRVLPGTVWMTLVHCMPKSGTLQPPGYWHSLSSRLSSGGVPFSPASPGLVQSLIKERDHTVTLSLPAWTTASSPPLLCGAVGESGRGEFHVLILVIAHETQTLS